MRELPLSHFLPRTCGESKLDYSYLGYEVHLEVSLTTLLGLLEYQVCRE